MRYSGVYSREGMNDSYFLINITRKEREFIELSPLTLEDRERTAKGEPSKDVILDSGLLNSATLLRNLKKYVLGSIRVTSPIALKDSLTTGKATIETFGNYHLAKEAMDMFYVHYRWNFPYDNVTRTKSNERVVTVNRASTVFHNEQETVRDSFNNEIIYVDKGDGNYIRLEDIIELGHIKLDTSEDGVVNLTKLNDDLSSYGYLAYKESKTKRVGTRVANDTKDTIYDYREEAFDDTYLLDRRWKGISKTTPINDVDNLSAYPFYLDITDLRANAVYIFEKSSRGTKIKLEYKIMLDSNDLAQINNSLSRVSPVTAVTFLSLSQSHDTSWYIKDGKRLKEYSSVKTIRELEILMLLDLVKSIKSVLTPVKEEHDIPRYEAINDEIDIGVDTETEGFGVLNLKVDNPNKDDVVAIPMSWRDDQAIVIYTKMKHFRNLPVEYLIKRLEKFLCTSSQDEWIDLVAYDVPGYVNYYPGFDETVYPVLDSVSIKRSDYNLIFHNLIFDLKAFHTMGISLQADDDTLQMAFRSNPNTPMDRIERGLSLGLKHFSKTVFKFNVLELSDVVGKGHEAEYNEISDDDVALIYGGADAEGTRKLKRFIRKHIISPELYALYKEHDIPIMHLLARAEFEGIRFDIEKMSETYDRLHDDLDTLTEFSRRYVGSIVKLRNKQYHVNDTHRMLVKKFVFKMFDDRDVALLTPKEREMFDAVSEDLYNKACEMTDRVYDQEVITYHNLDDATTKKQREEWEKENAQLRIKKEGYYTFDFGKDSAKHVIFDILGYPKVHFTKSPSTGRISPSTAKEAVKIWLGEDREKPGNYMKEDLLAYDGSVLISADEFNKKKYPLALIMKKHSAINKNVVSYLKPFVTKNLEGRMFKNNNTARIVTGRIANPLQTCNDATKKMALSDGDDYYVMVYDMNQVEYRAVISLFNTPEMIKHMNDPEADFHREMAGILMGKPPSSITSAERSESKAINFGILYGMGITRLAFNLYKEVNTRTSSMAQQLMDKFFSTVPAVEVGLRETKEEAITAHEIDAIKRAFFGFGLNEEIGMVTNALGFSKMSSVQDATKQEKARIQRQVANFKIQSYARELFVKTVLDLYEAVDKEGLSGLVKLHLTVHDEAFNSVHKSVHPFRLFRIMLDNCIIRKEGHTVYYIGAGISNSWYGGKKQDLPHLFMVEMAEKYERGEINDVFDHTKAGEYVDRHFVDWKLKRIDEVVNTIVPTLHLDDTFDMKHVYDKFTNYAVRGMLEEMYPKNRKPREGDDADTFLSHLETYLIKKLGHNILIQDTNGNEYDLLSNTKDKSDEILPDDFEDFSDDDFDDFENDMYTQLDTELMNEANGITDMESLLNADALETEYARIEVGFYAKNYEGSDLKDAIDSYVNENPGKPIPKRLFEKCEVHDFRYIRSVASGKEIYCPTKVMEREALKYLDDKLGYVGSKIYIRNSSGIAYYVGKAIGTFKDDELEKILESVKFVYKRLKEVDGGYRLYMPNKLSAYAILSGFKARALPINELHLYSNENLHVIDICYDNEVLDTIYLRESFDLKAIDEKYHNFIGIDKIPFSNFTVKYDYIYSREINPDSLSRLGKIYDSIKLPKGKGVPLLVRFKGGYEKLLHVPSSKLKKLDAVFNSF